MRMAKPGARDSEKTLSRARCPRQVRQPGNLWQQRIFGPSFEWVGSIKVPVGPLQASGKELRRCSPAMNELAAQIVGLRKDEGQALDPPGELGFHCPVCQYPLFHDGEYDDRLKWSQYNGFLSCSVCGKNYPSALCMPNVDRAIKIYLLCVKEAIERSRQDGA
jgi:hypothetical protein